MPPNSDDESSTAKDSVANKETTTRQYVTELNDHDVLLGRGTGPNNNHGNIQFRIAVEGLKAAYVSTTSRKAKNRIVRKTVDAVKAKKGRFLSKLKKSQIKILDLPHKVVYEVATDETAVEKTKQALRYICYKKDAPQTNTGPAGRTKRTGRDDQSADDHSSDSSHLKLRTKNKTSASKLDSETVAPPRFQKKHDHIWPQGLSNNLPSRTTSPEALQAMRRGGGIQAQSLSGLSPLLAASIAGPLPPLTTQSLLMSGSSGTPLLSTNRMLRAAPAGNMLSDQQLLFLLRSRIRAGSTLPFLPPPHDAAALIFQSRSLLPVTPGNSASSSAMLAMALHQTRAEEQARLHSTLTEQVAIEADERLRHLLTQTKPPA